jgi:hypothetical protein
MASENETLFALTAGVATYADNAKSVSFSEAIAADGIV